MGPAKQLAGRGSASESKATAAGLILVGGDREFRDIYCSFRKDAGPACRLVETIEEAVAESERFPECCLLIEEEMANENSMLLRRWLAIERGRRVIVVTDDLNAEHLVNLLRCGYSGYLPRGAAVETIRKAAASVAAGEIWADRKIVAAALRGFTSVASNAGLTARETEILNRVSAGQDNRQIAAELFITRETVRWHLRSAYSKLGVHDRRLAARLGSVISTA